MLYQEVPLRLQETSILLNEILSKSIPIGKWARKIAWCKKTFNFGRIDWYIRIKSWYIRFKFICTHSLRYKYYRTVQHVDIAMGKDNNQNYISECTFILLSYEKNYLFHYYLPSKIKYKRDLKFVHQRVFKLTWFNSIMSWFI